MKNLLLSVLVTFILLGCCERAEALSSAGIRSEVRCEAGYKFLFVWYVNGEVVTVTQIFKHSDIDSDHYPPQPMRCK